MDREEIEFKIVAAGASLFFAALVAFCVQAFRIDARCTELGWAHSSITWNLKGYCINRVDQTDVVVPWEEAKKR